MSISLQALPAPRTTAPPDALSPTGEPVPGTFAESTLRPYPQSCVLTIAGRLDLATVGRLTAIFRCLDDARTQVDLDLSKVTFADCTGLGPIVDRAGRARGGAEPAPVLLRASRPVLRQLVVLGDEFGTHWPGDAAGRRRIGR